MDQQKIFMMFPDLQPDELMVLQALSETMDENQQRQFFGMYQGKRKEQQTLLLLAIIGFFGVAGVHRFVVGDHVLGVLYLFTAGFCGIGTIIDLINIKKITFDYNQKQAIETANMVKVLMR